MDTKQKTLTRTEAWRLDTELYADLDEESGLWCVFGNHSGFAYRNSMDEEQAKLYANELNSNKKNTFLA